MSDYKEIKRPLSKGHLTACDFYVCGIKMRHGISWEEVLVRLEIEILTLREGNKELEKELEWLLNRVDVNQGRRDTYYISMPCGRGKTDVPKSKKNLKLAAKTQGVSNE